MSFKNNFFNFIFISTLGVLLHFTYGWSHNNSFVGLFSATGESTWEHLKLIFFPMLLLTLLQIIFTKEALSENYLTIRTISILSGMLFIVVVFYTMLGILGTNYDLLNISLYFAGVLFALKTENRLYKKGTSLSSSTALLILIIFTISFFIFTFYPPNIGLFADPAL